VKPQLRELLSGALLCVIAACGERINGVDAAVQHAADAVANAATTARWVSAWGAAPYGPFPLGPLTGTAPVDPLSLTALTLFQGQQASNQSFRMIVHPTLGGSVVRIRLSNLMGDRPITFSSVRVDRRLAGAAVVPTGGLPVLFGGKNEIIVAPGAEAISDASSFQYAVGDDVSVSFHVVGDSGPMTWHAVSFGLNYVGPPGVDVTTDPSGVTFALQPTVGWFFLSGIDVAAADSPGSIVAIGDSITDGAYIIPESNTRWPDYLAHRLQSAGIAMGVVNEGINSNKVNADKESKIPAYQGPAAVNRFQRDVLDRASVRSVIIFEGTNDLGGGAKATDVYAGLRNMIDRAHAAGLCVVVGTITPRGNTPIVTWDAAKEAERQKLNGMLRALTDIEGIADFDKVMASPLDANQPNPLYYFPDQLHPTTVGTQVMANAVPIEALVPPPMGRCSR
jgi:lysophospholipase L1-like esterase